MSVKFNKLAKMYLILNSLGNAFVCILCTEQNQKKSNLTFCSTIPTIPTEEKIKKKKKEKNQQKNQTTQKTRNKQINPQTYCLYQNLQFRTSLTGAADNLSDIFKLWNRAE